MTPQQETYYKQQSRRVPVAVVRKGEKADQTDYFLHGRKMPLHEFKKLCKRMPPIEVIVVKNHRENER